MLEARYVELARTGSCRGPIRHWPMTSAGESSRWSAVSGKP